MASLLLEIQPMFAADIATFTHTHLRMKQRQALRHCLSPSDGDTHQNRQPAGLHLDLWRILRRFFCRRRVRFFFHFQRNLERAWSTKPGLRAMGGNFCGCGKPFPQLPSPGKGQFRSLGGCESGTGTTPPSQAQAQAPISPDGALPCFYGR